MVVPEALGWVVESWQPAGQPPTALVIHLVFTGAEHYAITHPGEITLWGVEDEAFIRNTLRKLEEYPTKAAILIAGGFHTPGITTYLKQQNIAYLSSLQEWTANLTSPATTRDLRMRSHHSLMS